MFGTSDGNRICTGIPGEIKKAMQQKSVPARFDHLFALTYALQSFEFWMHDNECWEPGQELEKAIKALAKAWRDMLKRSNEELGIDGELRGQASRHYSRSSRATLRAVRRRKIMSSSGAREGCGAGCRALGYRGRGREDRLWEHGRQRTIFDGGDE